MGRALDHEQSQAVKTEGTFELPGCDQQQSGLCLARVMATLAPLVLLPQRPTKNILKLWSPN